MPTIYSMPDAPPIPQDLKAALTTAGALATFERMAPSHRREHINAIEEAKKPETRAGRIENCVKWWPR